MWVCPKCGKQYVNRNTWHACGRWPLESHFEGRPKAKLLFAALRAALERDGPITVAVSKTRIEFMTRVRFAGCEFRRDYLRAAIWLRRRVDSPRMVRIDQYTEHDYGHFFEIREVEDLDSELLGLLREARGIGDQQHLVTKEDS